MSNVIDIQPYRERRERRDLEELHDMIEGDYHVGSLFDDWRDAIMRGLNEEPTETTDGWLITLLNEGDETRQED